MTQKNRLFVDMDGTLARFHDQASYLERMWEKDFFLDLKPFSSMTKGIRLFMKQHPDVEVFILSSKILGDPPYCEEEKNRWLDKRLPEIDTAHRLFPPVGVSKAEYIEGGITENDWLLDDYNRSLYQWQAAGGSVVKCHNNVNQLGLGAYGGDRGQRWAGAMVHTEDSPEMVAAELAAHMGLGYDLHEVANAHNVRIIDCAEPDSLDELSIVWRPMHIIMNLAGSSTFHALCSSHETLTFRNPLNAIRAVSSTRRDFDEIPVRTSEGLVYLTKSQIGDMSFNLAIPPAQLPRPSESAAVWAPFASKMYAMEAIRRAALSAVPQLDVGEPELE